MRLINYTRLITQFGEKMKSIFIIMTLIFGHGTKAEFGKSLSLSTDPGTGKYQLGVQFAYGPDLVGGTFNLNWSILFTSTISNQELNNLPPKIKWNLYNAKSDKYLTNWSQQPLEEKQQLHQASISLVDTLAKQTIGSQADLYLVFADQDGKPLYNLNIGNLCKKSPNYFINLTETEKKCFQVNIQDVEKSKDMFCKDWQLELQSYVKENIMTCEEAQNQFQKMSCGALTCQ